jgi:hypothetical protein
MNKEKQIRNIEVTKKNSETIADPRREVTH